MLNLDFYLLMCAHIKTVFKLSSELSIATVPLHECRLFCILNSVDQYVKCKMTERACGSAQIKFGNIPEKKKIFIPEFY